ncbi:DUF6205 family protein [Streptomyces xiamenensis]|uniref:DUF6205 family protein n=1 Tax=Streptomyces xiamenensis TaxID=408015 RepID=UPI003D732A57
MGYNTRITGEIKISPPLTNREIAGSAFLPGTTDRDVRLVVEEVTVETDDGTLIRRTATALEPSWEEPYKAYHLMEHITEAMTTWPGHEFSGHLECSGEDAGDLWRVVVRDGRVERIEPRIVWPD